MDRFHEEIEAGQGRCESRQNSRLESTEQRHYHDRGVIQNVVVSKAEQGSKSNTGSCCDAYAHQRESVTSGPSSQPVRGHGNSSRSIGKTHSQPQEKSFWIATAALSLYERARGGAQQMRNSPFRKGVFRTVRSNSGGNRRTDSHHRRGAIKGL